MAQKYLERYDISLDLIDLRTVKPIDFEAIVESLETTRKILILDTGVSTCSIASEIISYIAINHSSLLDKPPEKITMPDIPEPTSYGLTKNFYPRAADIAQKIISIIGIEGINPYQEIKKPSPHDVPGEWFKGPF